MNFESAFQPACTSYQLFVICEFKFVLSSHHLWYEWSCQWPQWNLCFPVHILIWEWTTSDYALLVFKVVSQFPIIPYIIHFTNLKKSIIKKAENWALWFWLLWFPQGKLTSKFISSTSFPFCSGNKLIQHLSQMCNSVLYTFEAP